MAILRELEVDLVLSGHRHVPYVGSSSGALVVHSGTVSTLRVRGTVPPSHNVIESDGGRSASARAGPGRACRARSAWLALRRPAATNEFYPELERFVRYDADPFAARSHRQVGHRPAR